jgi:hypothetical protein
VSCRERSEVLLREGVSFAGGSLRTSEHFLPVRLLFLGLGGQLNILIGSDSTKLVDTRPVWR